MSVSIQRFIAGRIAFNLCMVSVLLLPISTVPGAENENSAPEPAGIPVGSGLASTAGAVNAALLAAAIIGNTSPRIRQALERYRAERRDTVLASPDPSRA